MKRIGKNETTEMAPVKKCFVGLETALYLLFLALDAFSTGGDGIKYLTIVVCLLAAVWSARHGGSRLMAWAMAFTLAADRAMATSSVRPSRSLEANSNAVL